MTTPATRIAMWSGPRNISTAMLRAFGNRADAHVSDEPFYAAYLAQTGLIHPMHEQVLASQPQNWRDVAATLTGPVPGGKSVWYQKHMSHHMLPAFGYEWAIGLQNAFLIRAPEAVLASYVVRREVVALADIGLPQQVDWFNRLADRLGRAPPVLEANDLLAHPGAMLAVLCTSLGIAFDPAMLAWAKGKRDTDGVWAPAWYDKLEQSTSFGPPRVEMGFDGLDDRLKPVAEAARPLYQHLFQHRLKV